MRVSMMDTSIILRIFIALNFNYLDEAMRIREFLNARYDGDYHIEVFTVEG